MSRKSFVYHVVLLMILFVFCMEMETVDNGAVQTIVAILGLFAIWAIIACSVKRLHDINLSGLTLLWFLTIIGAYLFFYMLFAKGNPNENKYGRPPQNMPA